MKNEIISNERKIYLKKLKIKKYAILFTQVFFLIAFLSIWEILANKGFIDSFITSQPSRILKTFMNLSSNNLIKHIAVTSYETIIRFYYWYSIRSNYCNNIMVVRIFIKGCRTISSCAK